MISPPSDGVVRLPFNCFELWNAVIGKFDLLVDDRCQFD